MGVSNPSEKKTKRQKYSQSEKRKGGVREISFLGRKKADVTDQKKRKGQPLSEKKRCVVKRRKGQWVLHARESHGKRVPVEGVTGEPRYQKKKTSEEEKQKGRTVTFQVCRR